MSLSPIHHVTVSVADLDRSVAFYRDVLGFRRTMEAVVDDHEHEVYLRLAPGTTGRVAIMQADERTIGEVELVEWNPPLDATPPKRPGDPGVFLLAFEVTGENLADLVERMTAQGVEFWSDVQEMGIDGYGTIRAVVCEDPDGIMLEFLELPTREEIRRARAAYHASRATPAANPSADR